MLRQLWWRFFPPIEVKWTRDAIRQACKASMTSPELLPPCLAETKDVERVTYSIRIDGHTPETLAALLISNVAARLVTTGRYHIYRGVLSHSGNALLYAWTEANRHLVQAGRMTVPEQHEDWHELQRAIKGVG